MERQLRQFYTSDPEVAALRLELYVTTSFSLNQRQYLSCQKAECIPHFKSLSEINPCFEKCGRKLEYQKKFALAQYEQS